MKTYIFKSNKNFKVSNPASWAHQLALDLNEKNGSIFVVDELNGETTKNFDLTTESQHDIISGDAIKTRVILETDVNFKVNELNLVKGFFRGKNVDFDIEVNKSDS